MSRKRLLIFTDLDGTLLDRHTYRWEPAQEVLEELKQREIPVIPVTSKTRAEVLALLSQMGLRVPFIVENGSGIFFPPDQELIPPSSEKRYAGLPLIQLGTTYAEAQRALKALEEELGLELKGLGEMSPEEIAALTGLPLESARRARERDFSEAFIAPPKHLRELLSRLASRRGFRLLEGDRLMHIVGCRAGKGRAIRVLKTLFLKQLQSDEEVLVIGLGNSPNDLELLQEADIGIIIPGEKGPHPALEGQGIIAPAPGPEGWARAVRKLLREHLGK